MYFQVRAGKGINRCDRGMSTHQRAGPRDPPPFHPLGHSGPTGHFCQLCPRCLPVSACPAPRYTTSAAAAEADWIQELDGDEPTELTTQKNTAVRCIKDLYGFDLSACIFHRFMDLHYETYDGTQVRCWVRDMHPVGLGRLIQRF